MQTLQELERAIQRHEGYAEADPGNFLLRLTLGDLYHKAGRLDEANACYEHCLLQTPGDAVTRGRLASVMLSQQRFEEAEQCLRALIESDAPDASLVHNLGIALYCQKRWEEARRCFAEAIDRGIRTADVFAYLARTLHHLGLMPEAIQAASQWAELDRSNRSRSYLALLYMDNNDADNSIRLAREVLALDADDADANVVAGMAAAGKQDVGPARLHFETVLRQDKENGRAWAGLGIVQMYQQEHAKAIESLAHAARIFPDNPGIAVSLGWARLMARDPAGAQEAFEQAVRLNRTFSESHGGLASALATQHQFERAEQEIRIARRLDPNGFGAEFAESIILAARGEIQAAADLVDRAVQRSPREGVLPLLEQLRIYATMNTPPPGRGKPQG